MKTTKASPENYHHYNHRLRDKAREFRRHQTKGERILWEMLRRRNIYGFLFTRQRPVLDYVADFMCKELLFIIECDGIFHEMEDRIEKDRKRDNELREVGFTILRYKDWEIINRPEEILAEIKEGVEKLMVLKGLTPPRP